MFKDRLDAAHRLAEKLKTYQHSDAIILAIPRGGIEVGYVLSNQLSLPLDVIFSKKIGHPANKELAIGAVSLFGRTINENTNVSQEYIEEETVRLQKEIQEQYKLYEGTLGPKSLENRIVILTDDGIATGFTMLSAIELVKMNHPARVVVAVPVAPKLTLDKIALEVDEVICEESPITFQAIGEFYENFAQSTNEEVITLLKKANKDHIET